MTTALFFGMLFQSLCSGNQDQEFDLTVVSSIDFNGSVRRHAIGLIEILQDTLRINFIASRPVNLAGVSPEVQKVILSDAKTPGRVALLEDPLWYADPMPDSKIKIAFSVFESTRIPSTWVDILNHKFDAVVVADKFFIDVYKKSGVKIPIFHIPLGIYIDEFLQKPLKKVANQPFVFGCCARFFKRKNHTLLIKAFAKEFGNNDKVILRINGGGKWGSEDLWEQLQKLIKKLGVRNIHLTNDALSWQDYVELMSTMDCYVNISSGEGFSITPREALALGIPAIVSDNTAQKTICATQFVKSVRCPKRIPVYCRQSEEYVGYRFDCTLIDVRKALREVYDDYPSYLRKARQGRKWVQKYRWVNLRKKYLSLVKPQKILFGDRNEVTDTYLMTNSKKLYRKYLELSETPKQPKNYAK